MTSIALAVPIKPNRSDVWKQRAQEFMRDRREEVNADWWCFGIRRSASWLQHTEHGDLAILYWEVDQPQRLRERAEMIMSSDDEYYVSLRESLSDIFEEGPDRSNPSELVMDFRLESPAGEGERND